MSRLWYLLIAAVTFTRLHAALPGTPLPDTPLRNFQVQEPLPVPRDAKSCPVALLRHLFINSYGQPAIAEYNPTASCGPIGTWSAIVFNLTATSNGVSVTTELYMIFSERTRYIRRSMTVWR